MRAQGSHRYGSGLRSNFSLLRLSPAASTRPTSASPLSRGEKVFCEASCSRRQVWLHESNRRLWFLLLTGVAQPPVLLIVGVCGAALVLTVVLIYKWKSRSGLSSGFKISRFSSGNMIFT